MAQTAGSGPPLLVFTDLDGTLLDHESYDWSPARPALNRLSVRWWSLPRPKPGQRLRR